MSLRYFVSHNQKSPNTDNIKELRTTAYLQFLFWYSGNNRDCRLHLVADLVAVIFVSLDRNVFM